MIRRPMTVLAVALVAVSTLGALAQEPEPAIGKAAPAFSLPAVNGQTVALADLKGKCVVLEWTNYDCPFVKKHYGAGAMQALQKAWTAKGVAWLVINSSAPGKQGHYPAEKWVELAKERNSAPTAILLDPDGKVGRLYAAKTTPHLFVIGPDGTLLYAGAIDDKPSPDPATLKEAKNYVNLALEAALAGKPVETAQTKPYGCSVKY